jgi:hypothetical protein
VQERKIVVPEAETTKSLLGRIADAIDVKPVERVVGKPTFRRIKPMHEIRGAENALIGGAPKPTNSIVRHLDQEPKRFYTDGSLRHATPGLRGHAAKVARKKIRKMIRNHSTRRSAL